MKPNNPPVDIYELQAEIEARRAEQKAREEDRLKSKEQAQKEREAEYMQMVENLRNGIPNEEDTAKEARRRENIARAQMEY